MPVNPGRMAKFSKDAYEFLYSGASDVSVNYGNAAYDRAAEYSGSGSSDPLIDYIVTGVVLGGIAISTIVLFSGKGAGYGSSERDRKLMEYGEERAEWESRHPSGKGAKSSWKRFFGL